MEKLNPTEASECPERVAPLESIQNLLGNQALAVQNRLNSEIDRLLTYPRSYAEYEQLDLHSRLKAALDIFRLETPSLRPRSYKSDEQILNALSPPLHSFDISHLVDTDMDSVTGFIGYDNGRSVNALNSTHTYKYPHLNLSIATSHLGVSRKDHFADLELVQTDYNNNAFFNVVSGEPQLKAIETADTNHPFFRDVVMIVDAGVAELYRQKLTSRFNELNL